MEDGLDEKRGDGIILGASKLSHLRGNMRAAQAGPLPEALLSAFDEAWEITKAYSPEYFTFYSGGKK